jgi:hypothetical protein
MSNDQEELERVSQYIEETREAIRRVHGTNNEALEMKYLGVLELLLKKEDRLIQGKNKN